jgi:hypothetical protein
MGKEKLTHICILVLFKITFTNIYNNKKSGKFVKWLQKFTGNTLVRLFKHIKIEVYVSIILRVVLYVCKIWSLTLKEESRLRVFVNRVLRRDEVTGEWRKLHSEELNDLYSPNIIRLSNQEE